MVVILTVQDILPVLFYSQNDLRSSMRTCAKRIQPVPQSCLTINNLAMEVLYHLHDKPNETRGV